ncbi:uncharacterized protein LOC120422161 [Culex pipiens pallens]|uniref:uncharacterized protein LOC120422161 n=1 Tax=Culex pipiens pallens TaxID=42434 RepID=UPI0019539217|nr:uncharacterized protein LOC120422161 [Culex pipiens pallens]
MDFCKLCLRKCSPILIEWVNNSKSSEFVDAVESILRFRPEVDNLTICGTCWILVQLFGTFMEGCRAIKNLIGPKQQLAGVGSANDDHWQSDETEKALDYSLRTVRNHVQRINSLGVDREESADDERSQLEETQSDSTITVLRICRKCSRIVGDRKEHALVCDAFSTADPKRTFYTCSICSAEFLVRSHLQVHLNKHNRVKPYKCRKRCDTHFYGRVGRLNHEKTCKHAVRVCFYCEVKLESARDFAEHLASDHNVVSFL